MLVGGSAGRYAQISLSCIAALGAAIAQPFPTKPVRLVTPYPPGGGSDTREAARVGEHTDAVLRAAGAAG
jgi:tripartite-type tricarboxylate transporter receptor subunit TctC